MMLPNRFIILILIFTFISSSYSIFLSEADDLLEEDIDATFNIDIKSGTEFIVNLIADVKTIRLEASETSYKKNDIILISENDSEKMGAIKYDLKNSFTNQIRTIFDKSDIHSLNELPLFNNGLFYDTYSINLTSTFFSFENDVIVTDFINGILDMGAIVNYSLNINAEKGWNNTFNFILSDKIGYHRTTGIVNDKIIYWNIKNKDLEFYSKIAEFSLKYHNPTSSYENENIHIEFELNCDYNAEIFLKMSIISNSINIKKYSIIPNFITNLDYIPSDGVRLLIKNYFITWEDFYNNTINPHFNKIKPQIENSSLNQSLDFSFIWDINSTTNCSDEFDIKNMDNYPPIKAIFSDSRINLFINGVSTNAFFGLINSGARYNFSSDDLNFVKKFELTEYNYSIILKLPDNFFLKKKNIISWNNSNVFFGNASSNVSEEYFKEEINTEIQIDFQTTDLNILSLFTGDTKLTFGLYIQEIQNRNVTILPQYLELPNKFDLKYFNSDVIRLCIDEKIFDNESMDKFLSAELNLFEKRLEDIFSELKIKGVLNSEKFKDSLIWDNDVSNMSKEDPIIISFFSNMAHTLPFKFNFFPPSIDIDNQNFTLSGIKNHNLNYKIIFPKGINIKIFNQSDRISLYKTENEENIVEISFNGDEFGITETISLSVNPSFVFVISLFIPCIISLIIAVILLILIFILRNKRKKGIIIQSKATEINHETYEDKDYYIPPPPKK
jgi:hypothetical protein